MAKKLTINKVEIARRQLKAAYALYLADGDPLAVITLAGAAEEILGDILRRRGKTNVLDTMFAAEQKTNPTAEFKNLCNKMNHVKNNLKHADNPKEDTITVDVEFVPLAMLARAVLNYKELREPDSKKLFIEIFGKFMSALFKADKAKAVAKKRREVHP